METVMQTVWYIDDNNIRHYTVVKNEHELTFLKNRFDFVGLITELFG